MTIGMANDIVIDHEASWDEWEALFEAIRSSVVSMEPAPKRTVREIRELSPPPEVGA